ncbi:MAG: DNA polymerase III subunit gamma/tau [Patescibacteria group bacterium]|jgi:DNA polymerase-3 subunit gamma/tau
MSQALYRKYRPQTFKDVIGQDHIKQTLLNQLKGKKTSHAYLFCGPRGIGKTTLARLIAKSVNCLNQKEGDPCNECANCRMINENKALDIIEIDAASNTGVDNVRDNIINNALVSPSTLPYKVFIIDEVHMLSASAFNALLKTLEEPPERITFILATTEIHKVPATIISRCQKFDFRKVSGKEIIGKLKKITEAEKIQVDLAVLQQIAANSEGSARDAESLLSQVLALDDKHITAELAELVLPKTRFNLLVDFFILLAEKNTRGALEQINVMVDNGIDLNEFFKNFLEFLRKLMLFKIMGKLSDFDNLDFDQNIYQSVSNALQKITALEIASMISLFIQKNEELKNSLIVQLPLELASVAWCERKKEVAVAPPMAEPKKKAPLSEIKPLFSATLPQKKSEPQLNGANANLELDEASLAAVKEKWPIIIKNLREKNHSLALTLSIAQIVSFSKNNTLTIGVKYKFHRDRLCDHTNQGYIEEVVSKEMGRTVTLVCLVDDKYEAKRILTENAQSDNLDNVTEEDAANVWDLAVNSFGSDAKQ